MTTARDPRVDPRPGDVVRTDAGTKRTVSRLTSRSVYYNVPGFVKEWRVARKAWCSYCFGSEIVKVADVWDGGQAVSDYDRRTVEACIRAMKRSSEDEPGTGPGLFVEVADAEEGMRALLTTPAKERPDLSPELVEQFAEIIAENVTRRPIPMGWASDPLCNLDEQQQANIRRAAKATIAAMNAECTGVDSDFLRWALMGYWVEWDEDNSLFRIRNLWKNVKGTIGAEHPVIIGVNPGRQLTTVDAPEDVDRWIAEHPVGGRLKCAECEKLRDVFVKLFHAQQAKQSAWEELSESRSRHEDNSCDRANAESRWDEACAKAETALQEACALGRSAVEQKERP